MSWENFPEAQAEAKALEKVVFKLIIEGKHAPSFISGAQFMLIEALRVITAQKESTHDRDEPV